MPEFCANKHKNSGKVTQKIQTYMMQVNDGLSGK
jgi:hypothetical protein